MAQVNFRVDDAVKAKAESACAGMGISLSAAINIFLTKLGNERRIPFEISAPDDLLNSITDDEKVDIVAKRTLEKYIGAFKELAK